MSPILVLFWRSFYDTCQMYEFQRSSALLGFIIKSLSIYFIYKWLCNLFSTRRTHEFIVFVEIQTTQTYTQKMEFLLSPPPATPLPTSDLILLCDTYLIWFRNSLLFWYSESFFVLLWIKFYVYISSVNGIESWKARDVLFLGHLLETKVGLVI